MILFFQDSEVQSEIIFNDITLLVIRSLQLFIKIFSSHIILTDFTFYITLHIPNAKSENQNLICLPFPRKRYHALNMILKNQFGNCLLLFYIFLLKSYFGIKSSCFFSSHGSATFQLSLKSMASKNITKLEKEPT